MCYASIKLVKKTKKKLQNIDSIKLWISRTICLPFCTLYLSTSSALPNTSTSPLSCSFETMPPRIKSANSNGANWLGAKVERRKVKKYEITIFTSRKSTPIDTKVQKIGKKTRYTKITQIVTSNWYNTCLVLWMLISGERGNSGWLGMDQTFRDAKEFGFTNRNECHVSEGWRWKFEFWRFLVYYLAVSAG